MYYVNGNDNHNNSHYNLNASTYDLLECSFPGFWAGSVYISSPTTSISTAISSVSCHYLSPGCQNGT